MASDFRSEMARDGSGIVIASILVTLMASFGPMGSCGLGGKSRIHAGRDFSSPFTRHCASCSWRSLLGAS